MSDEIRVYVPETIPDTPLPQQVQGDFTSTQPSANNTFRPSETADNPLPTKHIAVELLSQALNTRSKKILQELQFTQQGAIQIGLFEAGVSGDIRISPLGIVGRDAAGNTTFAIDADTGDAVFTGTLQSRSLISGSVAVGDGDILIDGEGKRMIFYQNNIPVIVIGNVG